MTEYLIKKAPVPIKWVTLILIKVKPCNILLCMLLIYIIIYLKSALRYKFLILDTYHQNPYLSEQGCEDPWLFVNPKGAWNEKNLGNTKLYSITVRMTVLSYDTM